MIDDNDDDDEDEEEEEEEGNELEAPPSPSASPIPSPALEETQKHRPTTLNLTAPGTQVSLGGRRCPLPTPGVTVPFPPCCHCPFSPAFLRPSRPSPPRVPPFPALGAPPGDVAAGMSPCPRARATAVCGQPPQPPALPGNRGALGNFGPPPLSPRCWAGGAPGGVAVTARGHGPGSCPAALSPQGGAGGAPGSAPPGVPGGGDVVVLGPCVPPSAVPVPSSTLHLSSQNVSLIPVPCSPCPQAHHPLPSPPVPVPSCTHSHFPFPYPIFPIPISPFPSPSPRSPPVPVRAVPVGSRWFRPRSLIPGSAGIRRD